MDPLAGRGDETAERIGRLVDDRYKLIEVMASGSMGSVYKAERVPVGKLVAIKFLHASFANDSEFQARFERETNVASKLEHPNCVSVLDFGVWEGAPYLVMEYVRGTTLRSKLDKGPIAAETALRYARQIASGLAHAHDQGVVHRDIKPANIMITEEIGHGDRVRILDFGLARLRGNVGRDATQTNMVVGTPNYMAPEQTVPGATIDGRCDIYALGIVLFEMIVGDRPFVAEDTLQLLGMHRAAPIPRLKDRVVEGTELPAGVQGIIDRALAKSPGARYATAIELAEAIDKVLERDDNSVSVAPTLPVVDTGKVVNQIDIETGPVAKRSTFWRTMLTAMILVGGAAAMAGYLITRKPQAATQISVAPAGDAAGAPLVDDAAPGVDDAAATAASAQIGFDAAEAAPMVADAAGLTDAAEPDAADVDAGVAAAPGDAGLEEIEIDPNVAEDLDPQAKGSAAAQPEDEAADAPKTTEEVETKHVAPPKPQLAKNLHEAVQMIKDGKRDLAMASLRPLWRNTPASAYIPFLLGNLYYDKGWWGVAIDHYSIAIRKNAQYRNNPVINRNVIHMLGSASTTSKAKTFIRASIGHASLIYLRAAAARDPNPNVKKTAAALAREIR